MNPKKIELYKLRADNLTKLVNLNYRSLNHFCVENDLDYSATYRYFNCQLNIGNISAKRFEKIFNLPLGGLDKVNLNSVYEVPIYSIDKTYSSFNEYINQAPISKSLINFNELEQLKVTPTKQIGIKYNNNSMNPSIKDGWLMMIDTENRDTLEDGGVYALIYQGRFMMRNIYFGTNSATELTLKATNAEFPIIACNTQDIIIIGKPVYILLGKL